MSSIVRTLRMDHPLHWHTIAVYLTLLHHPPPCVGIQHFASAICSRPELINAAALRLRYWIVSSELLAVHMSALINGVYVSWHRSLTGVTNMTSACHWHLPAAAICTQPFYGPLGYCPGLPRVSWHQKGKTRKVKISLDLLEQEIVSGNGISWAIQGQIKA